jgi:hypothetical protein
LRSHSRNASVCTHREAERSRLAFRVTDRSSSQISFGQFTRALLLFQRRAQLRHLTLRCLSTLLRTPHRFVARRISSRLQRAARRAIATSSACAPDEVALLASRSTSATVDSTPRLLRCLQ